MFDHPDFDNHEKVDFIFQPDVGLQAIIAIHSTVRGPAFGGCRMWPYETVDSALTDALRLSKSMTYKAAICDLPLGGSKSVIIGDPNTRKTTELLHALGHVVDQFSGSYIIADDVGISMSDLSILRQVTSYTAASTSLARKPLAVTAYGVLVAIEAAGRHILGKEHLSGLTIAVQGLGAVGYPLCQYLHERRAQLVLADINQSRLEEACKKFDAIPVQADVIYEQDVDIFSPCALGGIINSETLSRLKAKIICGGANNQLQHDDLAGKLGERGIIYIPDYIAGAGGVIDYYQEKIDDRPQAIFASVERIKDVTLNILRKADDIGVAPLEIANKIVCDNLETASTGKS